MADGLKKTVSHATIYGIGNALQSAVGLLMLPIYTQYLTPHDYGTVSLLQIALQLASLLFGAQMAMGVFRHYYAETDQTARHELLSTVFMSTLASKLVAASAAALLSTPAAFLLFGDTTYAPYIVPFAFALVTDSLTNLPFQYVRILERPWLFVSLSLTKLVAQLTLNIVLIVHLKLGVWGVIYSTVGAGVLVGGGMAMWLLTKVGLRWRWSRARSLMRYSWPLVGSSLIGLYVGASNRIALGHAHSIADVGILALAWQFGSLTRTLFWRPFNQVWGPQRFRVAQEADAASTFRRGFTLITLVMVGVGTSIAVLSPDVITLMSNPKFKDAAYYVPGLVLADIFSIFTLFANTPLLMANRTVEILRSSMISAALTTIGMIALVIPFGVAGAVINSLLTSLVTLCWIATKARQHRDLGLPWRKLAMALTLAAITVALAQLAPVDPWLSVISKGTLLLGFAIAVFFSPILNDTDRARAYALVRKAAA